MDSHPNSTAVISRNFRTGLRGHMSISMCSCWSARISEPVSWCTFSWLILFYKWEWSGIMGVTTVTEMSVTYLGKVLCNFCSRDSWSYKSGLFCSLVSFFRHLKRAQLLSSFFFCNLQLESCMVFCSVYKMLLSWFSDLSSIWNNFIVKAVLHTQKCLN